MPDLTRILDDTEAFRITISVRRSGLWTWSVIGPHSQLTVIGLLQTICYELMQAVLHHRNPLMTQEKVDGRFG